ncbi:MAG: LytTR family transcriptional regulator DNA-binding domain-containing protein [Crocinitomicaceae bacterium]|nr:LytTR family transcriptional regulator DNA-binding domain-containing protein [Crocinitomicaceae bacterium]MBK8925666.1 LytTR family transcriptional regulator DNA-binding domain-containing protein [Crocinitomicaceae bacterium]
MRTIIVDDERLAREELKSLLSNYSDVDLIGEYKNTAEARIAIERDAPDLVFMDIQMPGETGLELLEKIQNPPRTVFVTAYDEHAIKAFELKAYDYLMKPVDPERLAEVFKRISEENKTPESVANNNKLCSGDRILIKDGDKVWFIKIDDVRYFESEGNYVKVHFEKFRPLILRSLNSLEERLDEKLFFRANRKFIINLQHIVNIESWFNGGLQVELTCGTKIEISRRQTIRFKDQFSI